MRLDDLTAEARGQALDVVRFFVDHGHPSSAEDLLIKEILASKHPSFYQRKDESAISAELSGLLYIDAVKLVLSDTVPKNSNVVETRISLAIKEFEDETEKWNARDVVQGCMERESRHIVSDPCCAAAISVRILLVLVFELGYSI